MDYINYVKQSPMIGMIGLGGGAAGLAFRSGSQAAGPFNGNRAIASGGGGPRINNIQYRSISSTGNFSDFGDLNTALYGSVAASGGNVGGDATRGLVMGGYGPAAAPNSRVNTIQYITIASTGNTSDFGDLARASNNPLGAVSNGPRIVHCGGYNDTLSPATREEMDYVETLTTGNATDFGDLISVRYAGSGTGDGLRGILFGGYSPTNSIDYIEIATLGNSADFGDLSGNAGTSSGSFGNGTLAFVGGLGELGIDKITVQTTGNGTDVGDLTANRWGNPGCSNGSAGERGIWMGGYDDGSNSNVVDYITMSSPGNATDFGDLQTATRGASGMSGAD